MKIYADYIVLDHLPQKVKQSFQEWLKGCYVHESQVSENDKGLRCAYRHDYDAWLAETTFSIGGNLKSSEIHMELREAV